MFNLKGGKVRKALTAVVAALAAALLMAPVASAIDKVDTTQLRDGVTVAGILEHEQAFQQIATANGGTRAATFPGYDASVQYVVNRMRAAGFRVSLDPFDFAQWEKNGPSTLERTSPDAEDLGRGHGLRRLAVLGRGRRRRRPCSSPATPSFRLPAGRAHR